VAAEEPVLDVRGLTVEYVTAGDPARAVDSVSFSVGPGEFLGVVGESGCGKSTMLFGVAGLLRPPAEVVAGEVIFRGRNLIGLTAKELRLSRWREYSVVMQSAMNALNPVKTIGAQFKDAMAAHGATKSCRAGCVNGR
jgi:peptide/nickel transport system ATP-binding protein